jgi:hypothetical protein
MFNDYYEYDIGGHFLSAMINGDCSGLNDVEEKQLNDFLDGLPVQGGIWDYMEDVAVDFVRCEVSGLRNDCVCMRLWFTKGQQ